MALCAAIVAVVVFALVPKGSTRPAPLSERQISTMERAALNRLPLPHSFHRLASRCPIGRCYVAAGTAGAVEARMPGLLRSGGFQPLGRLRAAEPIAQLRATHWSTATRDPLVIACKRISTSASAPVETCQDAARIGPTLVNILVRPEIACHGHTCVQLRKAEVIVWSAAVPPNA